jgi:hypothetical protein
MAFPSSFILSYGVCSQAGGGFVGIATDGDPGWGFHSSNFVGSYTSTKSPLTAATMVMADRAHPSTATLPQEWLVRDVIPNYVHQQNWNQTFQWKQVRIRGRSWDKGYETGYFRLST